MKSACHHKGGWYLAIARAARLGLSSGRLHRPVALEDREHGFELPDGGGFFVKPA
jgi:hypothetical protein